MVVHTLEAPQATALHAYEELAPVYDVLTAGHDYESWLGELEQLALRHGLKGRRVLDVACGTGKSFEPLLARGYWVSGCDLSPSMVDIARTRASEHGADVVVADMRELPDLGPVDWVTCLDDAVNYLLDFDELLSAFAGMRRALRPGGLLAFDVNTLRTYRADFASEFWQDGPETVICFRGSAGEEFPAGGLAEALFVSFVQTGDDAWRRVTSRHLQRHHPRPVVEAALEGAGLEIVTLCGQVTGGHLRPDPDELAHTKFVYLARRPL